MKTFTWRALRPFGLAQDMLRALRGGVVFLLSIRQLTMDAKENLCQQRKIHEMNL
jgi:hypothetical protein